MGTIRKQGFQNTIISYFGIIIGFVNVLILQPYMLKPDELGLTRILFSSSVLIATIFPLGLNGVTIKFFPKFKEPQTNNNGYLSFLVLAGLISYILFFGVVLFLKEELISKYSEKSPMFTEYFSYVMPLAFLSGFTSLFTVYLFCHFRTTYPSFINDIFNRIYLVVIVSIYFLHIVDFVWFMRLFALGYFFQLFLILIYVLQFEKINFKLNTILFKKIGIRKMISYSLIMWLATIASIALRNVDVLILGSYVSLDNVAIYTIAVTIAGIIEAPRWFFRKNC